MAESPFHSTKLKAIMSKSEKFRLVPRERNIETPCPLMKMGLDINSRTFIHDMAVLISPVVVGREICT